MSNIDPSKLVLKVRLDPFEGDVHVVPPLPTRHPLDSPYWGAIGRLETVRRIARRALALPYAAKAGKEEYAVALLGTLYAVRGFSPGKRVRL